jgi:hypothetical protein
MDYTRIRLRVAMVICIALFIAVTVWANSF